MNRSEIHGIGLDLGSTVAKFVEVKGGRIVRKAASPSHDIPQLLKAKKPKGRRDVFTTGYFRRSVKNLCAVTEITAAKHGIAQLYPKTDVEMILDIGGQDTKVVDLRTNQFILNDKCSAGTGAFLEFASNYFGVKVDDLGKLHARAKHPVTINNTCGVFAISEMISHMVSGAKKEDVIAGMHIAFARRMANMLPTGAKRIALIGGGAKNAGITSALKYELGSKVRLLIPEEPQFVNALGAVVYGNVNPRK